MRKNFLKTALMSFVTLAFMAPFSARAADCLPSPPNLVEPGSLTVGVSLGTPPTAFFKDDKPAGLDPELMTAVAKSMCLKPVFVNMAFAGLFPALIARKIDVIDSQVGITDARKEAFDFVPVFVGGVRLVTRKGSGLWFANESAACGHTFSAMAGSTQMAALEKVRASCPASAPMVLKPFGSQIEALNELSRGSVQASFVDWAAATYAAAQHPDDFVVASPILSGKGPGTPRNKIGIVFRKGEESNQKAVADAFNKLVASGAYDALLKKWSVEEGDVRKVN